LALSNCAQDVAKFILTEINEKRIYVGQDIFLSRLKNMTGHSPQNIGMSFDEINKTLRLNGMIGRKCGNPRRIQVRALEADFGSD